MHTDRLRLEQDVPSHPYSCTFQDRGYMCAPVLCHSRCEPEPGKRRGHMVATNGGYLQAADDAEEKGRDGITSQLRSGVCARRHHDASRRVSSRFADFPFS